MRDDDLDQILSGEQDIVPSSGFVPSVMEVVRREAETPPAIPFPWKRALPGLAAWALVLVSLVIAVLSWRGTEAGDSSVSAVSSELMAIVEAASAAGAVWIALALVLSFASVRLSMHLAGVRS